MAQHRDPTIPRPVLLGAGALLIFSLVFAGGGRYAEIGTTDTIDTDPVTVRALHFRDRDDGAANILLAETGEVIATLQPGAGDGFIRGVLRSLTRERSLHGVVGDTPFVLAWREGGGLSLDDPATGRRIDLRAFGADNAAAFAQLLTIETAPRGRSASTGGLAERTVD